MTSATTCSSTSTLPAYQLSGRGQCVSTSVNPRSAARPAASAKHSTLDSAYLPDASSERYLSTVEPVSSKRRALPATTRHHCSPSTPGLPVVTHPWPKRAASAMERGVLAATTNGTRGDCAQPGALRASTAP